MVRVVLVAFALLLAAAAGWMVKFYLSAQRDRLAELAATQKPLPLPTVDVLVAAGDVGISAIVTPQDLRWQPWPEDGVNTRYLTRKSSPDALEKLVGSAARQPLFAGEPVTEEKLVLRQDGGFLAAMLPSGRHAVAIKVDEASGVAGLLLPGDRVDVILTHPAPATDDGVAKRFLGETIVHDCRVMAVDQELRHDSGKASMPGKTVTLEVSDREAEAVALGRSLGVLALALRSSYANQSYPARDRPYTTSSDISLALREGQRPRLLPPVPAAEATPAYSVTVWHGLSSEVVTLLPP